MKSENTFITFLFCQGGKGGESKPKDGGKKGGGGGKGGKEGGKKGK